MTILRVSMGNVDAAKKYISDYMDKSFGDNDSNSDYSSSPLYNGLVAIKSSLESLLKDLENCNLNKLEQSTKQSRRDAGYLEGTAAARRKPKNKRNKKKKKKNNKSRKKVPIKQRTVSQPKVDEEAKLRLDAKRAKEECDMIVAKERAMSMASNALNKRVVEVADKEEEEVRPEGEAGKDLKKHADLFTQLTTKSAGSLHYKVKTEEVLKLLSKFGFGYKKVDGSKYSVSMLGDKGHIIIHNGHGNKDINGKLDSLSISLVQMLLLPESNRQVG